MGLTGLRRGSEVAGPRDLDPAGLAEVESLLTTRVSGHGLVLTSVSEELRPVTDAITAAAAGQALADLTAACVWRDA